MKYSHHLRRIFFLFIFFTISVSCDPEITAQDKESKEFFMLPFENENSIISGLFFKANGEKPAPTVILLQGYPGRDGDIMGIGAFLKNNGINSYTFNYRGSWKSKGLFSIENAINDVVRSVNFLKSPDISGKYNIDTTKIIILGYSLGSEFALLAGCSCPSVNKIISIATTNLKIIADHIEADTVYRRRHLQALESGSKVYHSYMKNQEFHTWLISNKGKFDLLKTVDTLSDKKVFLIGAWDDNLAPIEEHTIPLYRSFTKRNNLNCKMKLFESNHSFNNVLPELHQSILFWVKN